MVVKKQTSRLKKQVKEKSVKKTRAKKPKKNNYKTKVDLASRGLIYIGHLPHGFYEDEVKAFFKQFGIVTNVQICRSQKTARCKGYGYVEFLHAEVAKIAAESMNNYLMFKKRLECQFIPHEKRPKYLFNSKQNTPETCSTAVRREKVNTSRNKEIGQETHLKKANKSLKKLQKKVQRIQKFSKDYKFEPVDVPTDLKMNSNKKMFRVAEAETEKNKSENSNKGKDANKNSFKNQKNTAGNVLVSRSQSKTIKDKDKPEVKKGGVTKKSKKLPAKKLKNIAEKFINDNDISLVNNKKVIKTAKSNKAKVENKISTMKLPSPKKNKLKSPEISKHSLRVQKMTTDSKLDKIPMKNGGISKKSKKAALSNKKLDVLKQYANEVINDKTKSPTNIKIEKKVPMKAKNLKLKT